MAKKPKLGAGLPWYIGRVANPVELAGHLLNMAGGVTEARRAIRAAAAQRKGKLGRPPEGVNDVWYVLWADALRRRRRLSGSEALGMVCRGNKAMLRRLERLLEAYAAKHKLMPHVDRVKHFAENHPFKLVLRGKDVRRLQSRRQ